MTKLTGAACSLALLLLLIPCAAHATTPSTTEPAPILSPEPGGTPMPLPEGSTPPAAATDDAVKKPGDDVIVIGDSPDDDEEDFSFSNNDLFLGRAQKHSRAVRLIEAGVRFDIAPVNAVSKEALRQAEAQYPEVAEIRSYIQQHDDPQALVSMDLDQIQQQLLDLPELSGGDRADINAAFDELSPSERGQMEDAIHMMGTALADPEDAIGFTLSPFFTLNLDAIMLSLEIPLAGFQQGSDTDFTIGNINLDARFGHRWGAGPVDIGLTYGLHFYAPSGGERANSVALQNVLSTPRFRHEYLSLAPYLGLGLDVLGVFEFQAYGEFLEMFPVRGDVDHGYAVAFRYGASAILNVADAFAVNFDMDGMADVKNADGLDKLYLTPGLRFSFFGLKLGVGVQFPVALSGEKKVTSVGALDVGDANTINVVTTLSFAI